MQKKIKATLLLKILTYLVTLLFLFGMLFIFFRRNILYSSVGLAAVGIIMIFVWFLVDSGIFADFLIIFLQKKVNFDEDREKNWVKLLFKEKN